MPKTRTYPSQSKKKTKGSLHIRRLQAKKTGKSTSIERPKNTPDSTGPVGDVEVPSTSSAADDAPLCKIPRLDDGNQPASAVSSAAPATVHVSKHFSETEDSVSRSSSSAKQQGAVAGRSGPRVSSKTKGAAASQLGLKSEPKDSADVVPQFEVVTVPSTDHWKDGQPYHSDIVEPIATTEYLKCRLCLKNRGIVPLFLQNGQLRVTAVQIMTVTRVKMSAIDGLPPRICRKCGDLLQKCFNFKVQCEVADVTLRAKVIRTKTLQEVTCSDAYDKFSSLTSEMDETLAKLNELVASLKNLEAEHRSSNQSSAPSFECVDVRMVESPTPPEEVIFKTEIEIEEHMTEFADVKLESDLSDDGAAACEAEVDALATSPADQQEVVQTAVQASGPPRMQVLQPRSRGMSRLQVVLQGSSSRLGTQTPSKPSKLSGAEMLQTGGASKNTLRVQKAGKHHADNFPKSQLLQRDEVPTSQTRLRAGEYLGPPTVAEGGSLPNAHTFLQGGHVQRARLFVPGGRIPGPPHVVVQDGQLPRPRKLVQAGQLPRSQIFLPPGGLRRPQVVPQAGLPPASVDVRPEVWTTGVQPRKHMLMQAGRLHKKKYSMLTDEQLKEQYLQAADPFKMHTSGLAGEQLKKQTKGMSEQLETKSSVHTYELFKPQTSVHIGELLKMQNLLQAQDLSIRQTPLPTVEPVKIKSSERAGEELETQNLLQSGDLCKLQTHEDESFKVQSVMKTGETRSLAKNVEPHQMQSLVGRGEPCETQSLVQTGELCNELASTKDDSAAVIHTPVQVEEHADTVSSGGKTAKT